MNFTYIIMINFEMLEIFYEILVYIYIAISINQQCKSECIKLKDGTYTMSY